MWGMGVVKGLPWRAGGGRDGLLGVVAPLLLPEPNEKCCGLLALALQLTLQPMDLTPDGLMDNTK